MMQQRQTAQNYYYFALVLLGVLLSTVSRRLEPLFVTLPLAVALVHSRLWPARPALTVQCSIVPQRAFEGEPLSVHITVRADTPLPPTELWHLLPPRASCPASDNRLLLTLGAGEERTLTHRIVFERRGKYTLGQIHCRVHPETDLQPWLAVYNQEHVCDIYPRITPLPRHMPPLHTHVSCGNYVSRSVGEGLEFAGIRPYTSGDRLHRVHWRTSLKRQELYVNDYYTERNADVVLLLDTLATIGSPRHTTLDLMVRAAASLAAHYLYHKDRVGLVSYGGVCTWVQPALGYPQLYRILDALLETRTHFSYLAKDIAVIPPRVLPPGALIFAMTPLLDARIETALQDLVARAFQLVLIAISPAAVVLPPRRPGHAEATSRLWRLETDLRLREFRSLGVPVVLLESDDLWSALHPIMSRGRRWQIAR
jgi:uncharacterized protein (DUF58 family)